MKASLQDFITKIFTQIKNNYGNIDNTSDSNKPLSISQKKYIDDSYANSNAYTDQKIADLIGGAPETLDTLKEVSDAIAESKDVETALNNAIGTKANKAELDTHIGNDTIHITANERTNWNDSNSKKHTHSNKSVIDKITQTLLDNWNAAYNHISDTVKHITSSERTAWNNKYAKPTNGIPKSDLASAVQASLGKADTALQAHQDISGKMDKANPTGTGSFSLNRKANTTVGSYSFAEGDGTTASGNYSHAEGKNTTASGIASHAEGSNYNSSGSELSSRKVTISDVEYTIKGSTAYGINSHAEGSQSFAYEYSSHAEGVGTTASGYYSHAECNLTTASGNASHAEGDSTIASGGSSHAEGYNTTASGISSHAEGYNIIANGNYQHVQGRYNIADTTSAFIIGNGSSNTARSNAMKVDWSGNLEIAGSFSTNRTSGSTIGAYSFAANSNNTASGTNSTAFGGSSKATGGWSLTEGWNTTSSGTASHAEGWDSVASNDCTHAEGKSNTASGFAAHAEGEENVASGTYSHAEGHFSTASGKSSHSEGENTKANGDYQHVQGRYNVADTTSAFIIGNGTDDSTRSNAMKVDWSGNLEVSGDLKDGSGNTLSKMAYSDDSGSGNLFNGVISGALSANFQNGVLTNTSTDSKTAFAFQIQVYNGSTLVLTSSQITATGGARNSISLTIPSTSNVTSLRLKHNGSQRDIYIDIPFTKTGNFTISLYVSKNNPSTVGGLEIKDIQIEEGTTATKYKPYIPSIKMLMAREVSNSALTTSVGEIWYSNLLELSNIAILSVNMGITKDISKGGVILNTPYTNTLLTSLGYTKKGAIIYLNTSGKIVCDSNISNGDILTLNCVIKIK